MPGIVGMITKSPPEEAVSQFARMIRSLRHESFYAVGTWVEESLGVYVACVAHRGSFSDGMPLRSERGDVILVFSGEEFPEQGTAQRLRGQGHEFDVAGPSYLVHLYEEDPWFPANLNGWFHGMVIDRRRGVAELFNDRYGMHRLYYHEGREAFHFAAEAKAILAVCPEAREIDPRGLGEFVACGCTLQDRSLFEGVHVLPAGARWTFGYGLRVKKDSYFKPQEWENQEPLEPESFYQEVREVFSQNLPRYFEGPERVGMSITGGLDTRMVMAWQKSGPETLPCYTFGGMLRECRDVEVGRKVAELSGQPFQVIPAGEEFLNRFPRYAERAVYLTDGCAGVSHAPDLYLNERARLIAPVRMTGLYGGEVLRRVRTFNPEMPVPGLFHPDFLPYVREAGETYGDVFRGHPLSFAVFKQAPWHQQGALALERTQVTMRSPFLDNDLVRRVFRAPESALSGDAVSWRLIGDGNAALLQAPTDRGLTGNGERFSAAISHAFLEFLFKAEYAYDVGMPQWVARIDHAFSPFHFERLFLGRHKIFHFRSWYRDALAGYVRQVLLDPRSLSRSYLERRMLEAIVRDHLKGTRNYTEEIHKVLTLELVHRLFLDNPEPVGSVQVHSAVPSVVSAGQ